MKFTSIVLLSFILLFSGCKEENNPVNPVEQPSTEIKISHLSHNSAREGEKIVVYGKNFSRYTSLWAELNGIYTASNKTSDSTISLFIPRNAQNGQFTLHFHSAIHDTVLYISGFSVEDHCTGFCIDWNTKAPIIESDSWMVMFTSDTIRWQSETGQDTIFFRRQGLCGDECSFTNEIAFRTGTAIEIPEFLYALYTRREAMGGPNINDTIKTGVVRIDTWNTIFKSGSFITEDHNWIFWTDYLFTTH
jgi:hypothetical protein